MWKYATLSLVLVLLMAGGMTGAPAPKQMPDFKDMREGSSFMIPCEQADPFVVWVVRFEAADDHPLWDAFLLRIQMVGKQKEDRPFMAMTTDGKDTFLYEWLDFNRDGKVDYEGDYVLKLDLDTGEGLEELEEHVCKAARGLR